MRLSLIFSFLLLAHFCNSQTITGKVLDTDTKDHLPNTKVFLTTKETTEDTTGICYWNIYKYKIIRDSKTDTAGNYTFSGLPEGIYNVIVVYDMPILEKWGLQGVRDDIDSNIIIKCNVYYTNTFCLEVTCPYDKTKNQDFCPNCKKKDKVKPIYTGLPIYTEDPDFINKYYFWGCVVDLYYTPKNHCYRCNIHF